MDPGYAKRSGDGGHVVDISLDWPEDEAAQFAAAADEDDDLYD